MKPNIDNDLHKALINSMHESFAHQIHLTTGEWGSRYQASNYKRKADILKRSQRGIINDMRRR